MNNVEDLLEPILQIHSLIRDQIILNCEKYSYEQLSEVASEAESDIIYFIDQSIEEMLLDLFAQKIANHVPIVLIAEGIADGKIVLPSSCNENDAVWRIIVDPIDGTRELMFQKRSAWILTGIAPNKHESTNLQDIELAIQTEIPVLKQHLCDILWAFRGKGMHCLRFNRLDKKSFPIPLIPSRAASIEHGFAMFSRFFPGAGDAMAAIEEELILSIVGPIQKGKELCFFDQYLSTGGQIYELISGHDRFIADLRPLAEKILQSRGTELGLCCHPYDICTELIAREAGVIITDELGKPLSAKLNVQDDVCWIGYANEKIRNLIEPKLQNILKSRNLI